MMPVRLEPAAILSRVKHSTTEPLCSLTYQLDHFHVISIVLLHLYINAFIFFAIQLENSYVNPCHAKDTPPNFLFC